MKVSRNDRYKGFQEFFDNSKELFREIADSDSRNKLFENIYSLCIVPGGWNGGTDKRIVEIYYGQRPFDEVVAPKKESGANPLANLHRTLLAEHGAILRYQRMDSGIVVCELRPATTENWRPIEDAIFLAWIVDPRILLNKRTLKTHWRTFMSYMHCTSLDGDPNWMDKLRVARLRFFKKRIVSGKDVGIRAVAFGESVLKYTLTVGLSGFILLFLDRCSNSTPLHEPNAVTIRVGNVRIEEKEVNRKYILAPASATTITKK